MVAKTYILSNLTLLNTRYKKAKQKEALLLSKLAVLELCGWIEESMDSIVKGISTRCLKESDNCKFVDNDIIKRTHGFDYQSHFRGMLIRTIGLINIERLEKSINQTKKTKLENTLSNLKVTRDTEAHSHIKGITHTVNAPSLTIQQFHDVYDGLVEIESFLKRTRY